MNGRALWDLQQLDTSIDQLTRRMTKLPEAAAAAEAQHAASALEAARRAAQQRAEAAATTIERIEHETETLTAKRTRLEQQLRTITEARQADALNHQIEALTQQRNDLDDEELMAMEEQAAANSELAELAARQPAVDSALGDANAALNTAMGAAAAQRDELTAQRDAARSALAADALDLYDSERARHGGVGIARLDGSRCDGCHLDLSRAEVDAIRAAPDGISECPQCSRVLVV